MRVIPVIDLMGGQVVRGIAGRRDEYRPVVSQIAADARPATVARALVERFGFDTVYVADLDAIVQGRPDVRAWSEIAGAGLRLWLDAGIGNASYAWRIVDQIVLAEIEVRLVVGLESLESEKDFFSIGEMHGFVPPIFSLDLHGGQPLVRNPAWKELTPLEIAMAAKSMEARDLIVLDLADVGVGGGTRTLNLCRQIAAVSRTQTLIAGGGVRGVGDLQALAEAGCKGALVASALHDRRLSRDDIDRAAQFQPLTSRRGLG
jgi:phosphoribosylformimino-5-aminoimidazole carboxamide ribotide isomerase